MRGKTRVLAACLLLVSAPGRADSIDVRVRGLEGAMRTNVKDTVEAYETGGDIRLSARRLQDISDNVARKAGEALRPFGYYHASARTELSESKAGDWLLEVHVETGPPVIIETVTVEVTGDGVDLEELETWRDDWPLEAGDRLDQRTWEEQKRIALEHAESSGYLGARFVEHRIEADLVRNSATLKLVLDTGPRAVLGSVQFEQDALQPGILDSLARFEPGQPYDAWLLERFRLDLWRTGYFDEIEIDEERQLDREPPVVNLTVRARARTPNTYQGTLGYGTDTGIRAQLFWNRHLLSRRGDTLNMGLGWQEKNNEYSFRTSYKLPRTSREREYWTADLFIRRENQDLEVRPDEDDADFVTLANGDATDYSVKAGRLIVRDLDDGYQQLFENWYAQFVLEDNTFSRSDVAISLDGVPLTAEDVETFDAVDSSLALGVNWDLPVIRGSGFATTGHHERAWVFTANEAWGSGKNFTQAYFSTNWHRMLGERFKLLLRGEVGYSDARVQNVSLEVDGETLDLSVTDLPNIYRFKAGGSRSVRGYAFESLSNNGLGSNNIVTASAEIEMRFRDDWSAAAFIDVGNAFNSWSDFELKRGAGVGLRWYSILGAIRLDVAQARDFSGNPWRIHFTLGTPLL
ncbi:autotransporter assembly complex protein TamA [Elongatibacter sediminis]|uniref:Translocation and assembly module subunit TamA n=1 Tax=Elongatibacter sediminis TaxID=3119006 RepID=A0AAW9RCY0_9GAMM